MAQGRTRAQREERERARRYEARKRLHEEQVARRRRDNVRASIVCGVIVLAAIAAQIVFYQAGPGAATEPEPAPTTDQLPETPTPETPAPLPLDDAG